MKQVLKYSYEYQNSEGVFYVRVNGELVPVKMPIEVMGAWADVGGPLTFVRKQIRDLIGHDDFELVKTGGKDA